MLVVFDMKWAKALGLATCCAFLAIACGDDDDSSASNACRDGCVATVAAGCENGPDQKTCESSCKTFETGSCATQFNALRGCYEGKTITCSTSGTPTAVGCADQELAFVSCLSQ